MNPEELIKFNEMVRKVNEIYSWMQEKKLKQLSYPLDNVSLSVLNETFRNRYFDVIKTRELFFKPGLSVNPSIEGQMLYHENGGTQVIKIFLDGAVKTITTS